MRITKIVYTCPVSKEEVAVAPADCYFGSGQYYDDWHYSYCRVSRCPSCGQEHRQEF